MKLASFILSGIFLFISGEAYSRHSYLLSIAFLIWGFIFMMALTDRRK